MYMTNKFFKLFKKSDYLIIAFLLLIIPFLIRLNIIINKMFDFLLNCKKIK